MMSLTAAMSQEKMKAGIKPMMMGSYNDRLLLGLKGTMSEAELHILKQRMLEGKKAKARRGELVLLLPMGYIRRPSGEVVKDPDEQAQAVIELVFEIFARRGTINAVLRHLVEHQIQMPYRMVSGPSKGELQWRRPNRRRCCLQCRSNLGRRWSRPGPRTPPPRHC